MDAGSVLGVPAVRPALLDDLPAACPAEAETRGRTNDMTQPAAHEHPDPSPAWCDDDVDDEFDDESDDDDSDDDDDADDEDDDGDEDEPETWQVHAGICAINGSPFA